MKNGSDTVVLAETKVERDLGVLVDSQLTFKDHISQAVAKSNKLLGIIRRSFVHLDEDTIRLLFRGIVRPVLEYGQAVWSPFKLGEQRRLESVQRRATRMIPGIRHLSYSKRLRHGLPLRTEVVSACSVNAFKNRLDEHWKDLAFDYE